MFEVVVVRCGCIGFDFFVRIVCFYFFVVGVGGVEL